ncbi:TPA: hypothetical protein ENS27_18610 [bacterium]|nr:hypothetical protein [bacterium]
MWEIIGIWIAAGLTLCVFSFLYKDNPLYKFAEHLYIGLSVGYTIAQTWHEAIIKFVWYPISQEGNYLIFIPAGIGLLMFSRFIPKYRWIIRWPLAFMIGISAGASIPRNMDSMIFKQMQATIQPLSSINLIIIVLGLLFTLLYFFFSVEHKGPIGVASKVGIFFLMISFGAAFGYTVMARISLLIGRTYFLLHDWLHIVR